MRLYNLGDYYQDGFSNYYCPTCKCQGRSPHSIGCLDAKVRISSTARFPKKNASKKVWDKFYNKFVLQLDLIEMLQRIKNRKLSNSELTSKIRRKLKYKL